MDKSATFTAVSRAGSLLSPYLNMTAFDLQGLLHLLVTMSVEEKVDFDSVMCLLCQGARKDNPQCKDRECYVS